MSPLLRYVSRGDRFPRPPTELREVTWFDLLAKLWRNFSVELARTTDWAPGLNLLLDWVRGARVCNFSTLSSGSSVDVRAGRLTPAGAALVSEGSEAAFRRPSSEVLVSGTTSADMIWVVGSMRWLCSLFRGTEAEVIFFWEFSFSGVVQVCAVWLSPKPPLHILESRTSSLAPFISVVWSKKAHVKLGSESF